MTPPAESVVVDTTLGRLRGRREGGLEVFRGVPYARPPVGELRLRPPQPATAWQGERDAGHFGAAPLQTSDGMAERLGLFPSGELSEDCLTLNLWSPGVADGLRPVMLWIHGGAFLQGAGSVPLYSGASLAARGDVVVVTLNYRVGALGFACLPDDAGGANFGLLDQIAALRWLRRELSHFGGDARRITVFGESAGAGSITALLAMPEAAGLFRRAIIQSPAPGGMLDRSEAQARTLLLTDELGIAAGDFERLRKAPAEALLGAQAVLAAAGPYSKGMLYMPVVDGSTLPAFPLARIEAGSAAPVDVMIGTTRDEMRLFNLTSPTDTIDDALLEVIVAAQLPPGLADPKGEAVRAVSRYRELRSARGESSAAGDLFCEMQTDLSMRHPATELAAQQARFNPNTYMYLFAWPSALLGGALGACHVIDIPFVLGNLSAPGMREFAGSGATAEELSRAVMDAWLAFAREGAPSHASAGTWPGYEATRRSTMRIDHRWTLLEAPLEEERLVWEGIALASSRSGD